MTWHALDEKILPKGVVSVDTEKGRVIFGVSTVRAWKLRRFQTVTPMVNSVPGLVAFQLYSDDKGRHILARAKARDTFSVSCQAALRKAGAERGRYLAHRETDGLIIVDFSRKLPEGWVPYRH